MATELENNESAVVQLAACLAHEHPLLMVGSGLSKLVGYPLLPELLRGMHGDLGVQLPVNHPVLTARDDELSQKADVYADDIKRLINPERRHDFAGYLRRRFGPQDSDVPPDIAVHMRLMALPFRGILTTNYDHTLERVATDYIATMKRESPRQDQAWTAREEADLCMHRDLCRGNDPTPVFDFLRRLASARNSCCRTEVLHLHGHYDNPSELILTRTDYVARYGPLLPELAPEPGGPVPFHHKVIWTLLVTYPFVFVGFGMKDPFFMRMQEIINREFALGSAYVRARHFAIVPRSGVESEAMVRERMLTSAILPVTYALESHDDAGHRKGLHAILDQIGAQVADLAATRPHRPLLPPVAPGGPGPRGEEIPATAVTEKMLRKR